MNAAWLSLRCVPFLLHIVATQLKSVSSHATQCWTLVAFANLWSTTGCVCIAGVMVSYSRFLLWWSPIDSDSSLSFLYWRRNNCLSLFNSSSSCLTSSISYLDRFFLEESLSRNAPLPLLAISKLAVDLSYCWSWHSSSTPERTQVACQQVDFGFARCAASCWSWLWRSCLGWLLSPSCTVHHTPTFCRGGASPSHPADAWAELASSSHALESPRWWGHQSEALLTPSLLTA